MRPFGGEMNFVFAIEFKFPMHQFDGEIVFEIEFKFLMRQFDGEMN